MTNGYTKPAAAIAVLIAASAIPLFVNTQTISAQQKGGPPPIESITMTVQLQPHENEVLAKDGYFQVSTLDMNVTKGSKLCPSEDCQYSIENGQFRPNMFSGGYTFDGLLKVSVTIGNTTNSKFYSMRADLEKTASQEREGQTTEMLQGLIKFGKNIFSPDFEYEVVNGTLLVDQSSPVLTLRAVKG